jgi:hypothetical protein
MPGVSRRLKHDVGSGLNRLSRASTVVGTIILGTVGLLLLIVVSATGLELFLRVRPFQLPPKAHRGSSAGLTPRFDQLDRAYEPFLAQYLHPQYLFFFPLDPGARRALSNETATIDADGFRGPGPANAGGRRLAFLLGGSSAFGWYASSDATTITGYLNRLQDRYFFVNAAVPSWNSSQEMSRAAFQILDYHPALVITYDGFNDPVIAEDDYQRGFTYPAGTPAHFAALSAVVGRSSRVRFGAPGLVTVNHAGPTDTVRREEGSSARRLLEYLFPELAGRVNARLSALIPIRPEPARLPPLPDSAIEASANRYLSNLARIHDMTMARDARFIAVFQPVALLHRHVLSPPPFEQFKVVERFHHAVVANGTRQFEFHDLGNVFDQYDERVPVRNPDITDDTVFVDDMHLADAGNERVARHLARLLP